MNRFVRLLNEDDGGVYDAGVGSGTDTVETEKGSDDVIPFKSKEEEILEAHENAEREAEAENKKSAAGTPGAPGTPAGEAKVTDKAPVIDDATIAKMADVVAARMTPKQPAKKGFEVTPEVIASLKPVRVTKEFLSDLFPDASDVQVAKMQQFANMIVENSVLTSRLINNQTLEREKAQFAPIVDFYEEQQSKLAQKAFFEANTDIAKFPKFVSAAAARVSATDAQGNEKTASQVAKEVADLTRAMLKEAIPTFGTDNANPDAAPGKKEVPAMASLSGAGRSLSASKGTGKGNNPDADIYN